ncbi:MAG: hypothetical protein U9R52_00260 [Candidatus Omnitrophota bacterium]|nr:hypothetical protein [Candidatus Omnitrophota bacterium]
MIIRRRFFVIIAAIFVICILVFGKNSMAAGPYLHEGDAHMFDGELEDAQKIYEFILKKDPDNYNTLWRLSRFYVLRGMIPERIKDKKKEWKEAEKYARHAVEINPDKTEGHLYLAIALGKMALYSSPGEKVRVVREIKKEAEKAIELDPERQKAYLALGAWHRNVATASSLEKGIAKIFFGKLPESSIEESLGLLLKSIEKGGVNVRNYYELALTYEAMADYKAAKSEFDKALAARPVYPEDAGIKEKIKKVLRKSRYNLKGEK